MRRQTHRPILIMAVLALVLLPLRSMALGLADASTGPATETAHDADDGTIETEVAPAPAEDLQTPETAAQEPDDDDSATSTSSVKDTPIGVMLAFLSGLVALAIAMLRMSWVDAWLVANNAKKYKPLIAAGLGGIAAVVALVVTGATDPAMLVNGAVTGIVAGLGATGAHQAVKG